MSQENMDRFASLKNLAGSLPGLKQVSEATISEKIDQAVGVLASLGSYIEAEEADLGEIRYRRSRAEFQWQQEEALLREQLKNVDLAALNYLVLEAIASRITNADKITIEQSRLTTGFSIFCRALGLNVANIKQYSGVQQKKRSELIAAAKAGINQEINTLVQDEKNCGDQIIAKSEKIVQEEAIRDEAQRKIVLIEQDIKAVDEEISMLKVEEENANRLAEDILTKLQTRLKEWGISENETIHNIKIKLEEKYSSKSNEGESLCVQIESIKTKIETLEKEKIALKAQQHEREKQQKDLDKVCENITLTNQRIAKTQQKHKKAKLSLSEIQSAIDNKQPKFKKIVQKLARVQLRRLKISKKIDGNRVRQKNLTLNLEQVHSSRESIAAQLDSKQTALRHKESQLKETQDELDKFGTNNHFIIDGNMLAALKNKKEKINGHRMAVKENKKKLKALKKNIDEYQEKFKPLNSDAMFADEQMQDLKHQKEILKREYRESKKELHIIKQSYKDAKDLMQAQLKKKSSQCTINTLRIEISDLQAILTQLNNHKLELVIKEKQLNDDKEKLINEEKELSARRGVIINKANGLSRKNSVLMAEMRVLEYWKKIQQQEIDEHTKQIDALSAVKEQLIAGKEKLENGLRQLRGKISSLEKKSACFDRDKKKLQDKYKTLKIQKNIVNFICDNIKETQAKIENVTALQQQAQKYKHGQTRLGKEKSILEGKRSANDKQKIQADTRIGQLKKTQKDLALIKRDIIKDIKDKQNALIEVPKHSYDLSHSLSSEEIKKEFETSSYNKDCSEALLLDAHIMISIAKGHNACRSEIKNTLVALNNCTAKSLLDPQGIKLHTKDLKNKIEKVQAEIQQDLQQPDCDETDKRFLQDLWDALYEFGCIVGRAFAAIPQVTKTVWWRNSIFTNVRHKDNSILAVETSESITALVSSR